jgi:integrase
LIDRLPIPAKKPNGKAHQEIYRDNSLLGFGLLVGSGGTKSFFIEKRVNGRVKRVSIGKYGQLTPVQARNKAQEMLGVIASGGDPAAKKRASAAKNVTLQDAFEDYCLTRKNLKAGTLKNYNECIKGCFADWLNKKLIQITKDEVEARHYKIGSTAPARSNNAMRVLRAIFNHAIAKYEDESGKPIITVNPVDRLSKSRAWYRVDRRRTYLKPYELKAWYEATLQLSQEVSRDYLHFVLFTGLRKMEAASLQWSQVNFNDLTFNIPDTKNREPHSLPLTPFLVEVLKRRQINNNSKWVFQSPVDDTFLKEPRGSLKQVSESMDKTVTLHDLRRTFITIAESLDIPAYALKQLLNHKNPNDVTAGYIISDVERIRKPMEKISLFITNNLEDTTCG